MGLDTEPAAGVGSPIDCRWEAHVAADDRSPDLLPGTLDLLILRTLVRGPMHGYGIADRLRQVSEGVLQVGESSLYPALQRLLLNGWVRAAWGASENNRRARYYELTAAGRRRLGAEREEFERLVGAIQRVLHTA
jgi:PadR family transcriptional regulator, regulatory protein PadR